MPLEYNNIKNRKIKRAKKPVIIYQFLESNTQCWRLPTFAKKTIIGSTRLNFSVRNGKRCDPCDKSPTLKTRLQKIMHKEFLRNVWVPCPYDLEGAVSRKFFVGNFSIFL